jgi:hypothetical protein
MVAPRRLFFGITRQGCPFVWPARLPGPDGRPNLWTDTALEAAKAATGRWIRLVADMALGGYVYVTARVERPEPQWPVMSPAEVLRLAFHCYHIDSLDHVVLQQLRGEI